MAATIGGGGGGSVTPTSTATQPTNPYSGQSTTQPTNPYSGQSTTRPSRPPAKAPTDTYTAPKGEPAPVEVRRGDTLGAIAERYHIPLKDLLAANPQLTGQQRDPHGRPRSHTGHWIYPGDKVILPRQSHASRIARAVHHIQGQGTPATTTATQPSNPYGSSTTTTQPSNPYGGGSSARADFAQTYARIQQLDPKAADYPARLVDLAAQAGDDLAKDPSLAEDKTVQQQFNRITEQVAALARTAKPPTTQPANPY